MPEGRRRTKWDLLAGRLGLVPVRSRALGFERTRALVGRRGGYLVAVAPRHGLNESSVEVLVRFPQQSTVRGLREDLLADPALRAAFGRKRRLPRRVRRNLLVGDGAVLLRLPYAVLAPTSRRVERALDGLVEAMGRNVRPLDEACESCGLAAEANIYLADEVPTILCAPCVERVRRGDVELAERLRDRSPDLSRGARVGAAAAAAVGVAAGAAAALGPILAPARATAVAAAVAVATGGAVAAFASRGFGAESAATAAAKAAFAVAGSAVAFTTANAVATMTLRPAEWGLALAVASSWGAAAAAPRAAAALAGCALAGALVEVAAAAIARRRAARFTRIERVTPPA